jgi:hypothetical protein
MGEISSEWVGWRVKLLRAGLRAGGWAMGLLVGFSMVAAEMNPPLGPYVNLRDEHFAESSSYTAEDRLVLTPYFYWYDVGTGAHIYNGDGSDALTDHPVTMEGFSYRSAAWHEGELRDMIEAGVQVVLPVYWGEPSQRLANQPISAQPWSYAGLPPLVAARETLLGEGLEPPRIGLFYDTSTLEYNVVGRKIDLTTAEGRQWFYETIRDFYSLIPPKHWAMMDGRPIVFLYSASFASAHDQSCLEYLKEAFARDFGGREPHVVREISWQVATENVYAWGGALGLKNPGVASLGPGYDHSAVPGREPLVVDREGGAFFERNWIRFLRRPTPWVFIETWNEFHEGTEIAATLEYGREYIRLNRKYADLFQAGVRPPLPRGEYSDFREVEVRLQGVNEARGVVQVESEDGVTEPAEVGGRWCRRAVATPHGGKYVYFRIDDSFKWADLMRVDLELEYYDGGAGTFTVEFDGSDSSAPFAGAYTRASRSVSLTGSGVWRTAVFPLSAARLLNGQNAGSDFRIVVEAEPFHVERVRVRRLGVPDEAGQMIQGVAQDFAVAWGTNWVVWGGDGATMQQSDGMVRMSGGADAVTRLALQTAGMTEVTHEVLARIRVVRAAQAGTWVGGVFVGGSAGSSGGMECQLRTTPSGGTELALRDRLIAGGPAGMSDWQANRWYWLRLRHAPNRDGVDVMGRLWPADGETAEPAQWQVSWDYYPRDTERMGLVGLVAPESAAKSEMECDFILVRDEGFSEGLVRLPGLKPERARLTWTPIAAGQALGLVGSPYQGYAIESTPDFREWSSWPVFTDALGFAQARSTQVDLVGGWFYRARVVD